VSKIAIIGAGASGIMAALVASNNDLEIDLYEKNNSIGKKILISGNGRCNISNINLKKENYITQNPDFVENVFKRFDFNNFKKFCENMGLYLRVEQDGKVYPFSNSAKSVIEIFKENLKEKKVNILTDTVVNEIIKKDNNFIISSSIGIKKYDMVLVCVGSYAAEQLGGTLVGYDIAKKFNHKIINIFPSLVQLETNFKSLSILNGVKMDAKVSIVGIREKLKTNGDVLFTKYGLSGFAILDISPYVCKMLQNSDSVVLSVDFIKKYNRQELLGIFQKIQKLHGHYSLINLLVGFINIKLSKALLLELNLNKDVKIKNIGLKDMRMIVNMLVDWRFEIKKSHGFKYAEVCGGGIDTTKIKDKTMESKLVNNLYFAGELLDVVGKRGGYNLAFAWSCGYLAGLSIKKKSALKKRSF